MPFRFKLSKEIVPQGENLSRLENLINLETVRKSRICQSRNLYLKRKEAGIESLSWERYLDLVPEIEPYLLFPQVENYFSHLVLVDERGLDIEGAMDLFGIGLGPFFRASSEIGNRYDDRRRMRWIVCQSDRHRASRMSNAWHNFEPREIAGNLLESLFFYFQDPTILTLPLKDGNFMSGSVDCPATTDQIFFRGGQYRCAILSLNEKGPYVDMVSHGAQHNRCAVYTRLAPLQEAHFMKGVDEYESLSA